SEIRQPLGYTIVGALMLSQLLTLSTTPVVYLYLGRLATILRRLCGSRSGLANALAPGGAAESVGRASPSFTHFDCSLL
ncbi:MAG TPA: hypothetical protein VE687_17850, partial [Stellaceae bacterium]|nr:hypothetical protein [Stellaceae bacterium]